METISNLMNHPVVCTKDTRISEIKHLLKKYDYDEILVVDSSQEMNPLGRVSLSDMEKEDVDENVGENRNPSDFSALECMRKLEAVVLEDSSVDECLNILRTSDLESLPVVDLNGHLKGVVNRRDLEMQLVSKLLH